MEIAGLPLHPLVIHAVVVLTPLAVLAAWAMALVPSWRWLTRWVALALTLGALGSVFVARVSGQALKEDRPFLTSAASAVRDQINLHEDRANVLTAVVVAFTVLVVLAFVLLPARSGLASGKGDHTGNAAGWLGVVLPGSVVVVGLVVLTWVALTGDAGARAVWKV